MSLALPGAPRLVVGASRLIVGAPRLVAGAPSYSEGRQECPPRVWYSPEIDASKFTLHILSDTPGGLQWLKYILLMLCNVTRRLGDGQGVILRQGVRGSITAVRAVRNTLVFLTETRVVADAHLLRHSWRLPVAKIYCADECGVCSILCMLYLVCAALRDNSRSWHGVMRRDLLTLCS